MLEFSYEIINEDTINIEYVYGSENFILNLFQKDSTWTLHPFDAILISNKELCRNVVAELIKNKYFQIMLAKEQIMLSGIRTTINLQEDMDDNHITYRNGHRREYRNDEWNDYKDSSKISDESKLATDVRELIEYNSFEDILTKELNEVEQKITLYGKVLEEMFMADYLPGNQEFDRVLALVNIYKEMKKKLEHMIDQCT